MPFPDSVKEEALVRSRRSCCVCNEFTGLFSNVHHIIQEADHGTNTLDNAIVLCLRCHGEAGHYNPKHPIGDKYKPSELTRHRDNWWEWCKNNPGRPIPQHPITISPSVIILAAGRSWRTKAQFNVYNKQQTIFYAVCIKIGIASQEVQFDHISIDIVKGGHGLKLNAGPVEINADVQQMIAIDQSGNKAIFVYIHTLTPNELYTFQVEQLPISKLSEFNTHHLNLGIVSFSETPPGTGEGSDSAFVTFTPPENIKAVSLKLLLRRTA
jgi:hypothetical protein